MKFIYSLLFLALLAFVAWPYYHVYRIDDALGKDDLEALAELVDLQAIQQEMTQRLDAGLEATTGQPPSGSVMGWLQQNLRQVGANLIGVVLNAVSVREGGYYYYQYYEYQGDRKGRPAAPWWRLFRRERKADRTD